MAAPRGIVTNSVIENAIDWYKVLKELPDMKMVAEGKPLVTV